MKKVVVFLLFYTQFFFSQTKVKGKVYDSEKPIIGAAVIIENKQKTIISYAISNEKGNYILKIDSKLDTLSIKVSFLGYKKVTRKIVNKNQNQDFNLLESSEELNEVVIKAPLPISKKGDTLSYNVSAFKDKKDRVIADVLGKMPGIEVESDGRILYEGKPIEKYYIEGLDLLEGKYNLANNNLSANAVSKIQILENHQPIKLLDSLVFSDKTSLNIKLKKNITVTGQAKFGIGLSPFLWDANITPMLFTKKQQMISSYQTNNRGNDIATEVKALTLEGLLDNVDNNFEKEDWLNIQELNNPPFDKKFWLDNNAHLITTNYLSRIQKDTDLKVNVSYVNDFQKQIGKRTTTFYTNGTINLTENTNNSLLFNALKTKLVYSKNKKKGYFKNTLDANKFWDSKNGLVSNNTSNIHQKVSNPYSTINNKLKWIFPLKKQLINLKSVIGYSKAPQSLAITPGVYEQILNNGNSFDKVVQDVDLSTFFTNNSVGFTKGLGRFSVSPEVGFLLQNQNLKSSIARFENNASQTLEDFQNDFDFNQSQIYTSINSQYKKNNWKLSLNLPLRYYNFEQKNNINQEKETLNKFVFESILSIRKEFNTFWRASISGGINNRFGGVSQLYSDYIIKNYRSIQRYNNPILETKSYNFSAGIFYRNPLKSLFINAFYSFNNNEKNLLRSNIIDENGLSTITFIEQDNTSNSHNINGRLSKYFRKLKSTITTQIGVSLSQREQLINSQLEDVNSQNIRVKNQLNSEINDWFSVDYNFNISFSKTNFQTQSFQTIINQEHLLGLVFYPKSNQYFKVENSLYKNNFSATNQENYFLNLKYKYTFEKQKIDIETSFNNILNTKSYTTASTGSFQYLQSEYQIRLRQFFVTVKFGF